jgi:hypothetical protein
MQDTNLDHRRAAAEDPIGGVIRRGAGDNGVPASTSTIVTDGDPRLAQFERNARGWLVGYYVYGRHVRLADQVFVTPDEARAWIAAPEQRQVRHFDSPRVIAGMVETPRGTAWKDA